MLFSASLLACFVETIAWDGPRAAIAGPAQAARGDLIVLDASASKASDFAWALVNSNKTFLAIDGGKKCVFASGEPGVYVFVLAVASQDRVAIALHRVTIGEVDPQPTPLPPGPGPTPLPTPSPTPDLPAGRFGLASFAWMSATSKVAGLAGQQAEQAARLAASFRTVAAAIVAGALTDADAILERTRAANNAALAKDAAAWHEWAQELAGRLESLDAAGKLVKPGDFAAAWVELAIGLEALRPTTR